MLAGALLCGQPFLRRGVAHVIELPVSPVIDAFAFRFDSGAQRGKCWRPLSRIASHGAGRVIMRRDSLVICCILSIRSGGVEGEYEHRIM